MNPTPLPSPWDSAIIRQLAYAGLGLVATILADVFNLTTTAFLERGGRVIDALLAFAVIAVPLLQAYRARKNLPTPPIQGTPAVQATAAREMSIARGGERGIARVGLLLVVASMAVAAALAGCAGTRDAYGQAGKVDYISRVEATAFVVSNHYLATVEQAAALKDSGKLDGRELEVVRQADDAVRPYIIGDAASGRDGLVDLVEAYTRVQSAENAAALEVAIAEAVVKLADFIRAVKAGS